MLDLGGILRRGIHQHAAVLAGQHRADLGLQIEVLLPADVQAPLQAMRCASQRSIGVATLLAVAVAHQLAAAQRLLHVEQRLQHLVVDQRGLRRLAGDLGVVGGHRQHHLPDVLHDPLGQQRIARPDGADVQLAGDVAAGDGDGHAGKGVARRGIDAQDARMGMLGQPRADVQLVGELQAVVDVQRRAGHVLVGALVLEAAADAAGDAGAKAFRQLLLGWLVRREFRPVHADTPG
ncbi:hypothetical protein D3C78_942380 [compost metagenome]